MRRILGWVLGLVVTIVLVVVLLDTFGGYFLDGPLGPIPGGAFAEGEVDPTPTPDWSNLPGVIELEIRPEKPWSLSVWNAVIDGELYVPSAMGERRRWTTVALADPHVRVRANGKIYERRIELVTDEAKRRQIGELIAERYGLEDSDESDLATTWFFHVTPRT
jgi:hypothetical protein